MSLGQPFVHHLGSLPVLDTVSTTCACPVQAPNGLLLGEVVLGCGPDGLKLPVTDGCTETISGNRRLR